MDASWGVVIVSVVGVLGTVAAAWITAHYSKKQSDAQRGYETATKHREELMVQARAFFAQIGVLDDLAERGNDGEVDDYFAKVHEAQRQLRILEPSLAAIAPSDVADAARDLVISYTGLGWGPGNTLPEKDALVSKLRAAVLKAE